MGALHGNMRRYPSDIGNEGIACTEKRDDRKAVWNSKRESWFPIYADVRKSPDANEGRAGFCVHEPEKVSKDQGKKRASGRKNFPAFFHFGHNLQDKRKWLWKFNSRAIFLL